MLIDENCKRQTTALSDRERNELLTQVPEWTYDNSRKMLTRTFKFNQYADGPSFAVNVGAMADNQNHHPDLHIFYKKCVVDFTTHSAGGVSRNDYICAARTDSLYTGYSPD